MAAGADLSDLDYTQIVSRQEIEINVGEYMSHDIDPADWDYKGMSSWAMSRFSADLKISRLRDMNPTEVMDTLTEKAHGLIDRRNLEGLDAYFVKHYAQRELAEEGTRVGRKRIARLMRVV